MAEPARKLLTREEVIEYLHVSRATFDRRVRPHLAVVPIGRCVRFRWEEVEAWERINQTQPSSETSGRASTRRASLGLDGATIGPRAQKIAARLRLKLSESSTR